MNNSKRNKILKNALTLEESRGVISPERRAYIDKRYDELSLLESIRELRVDSNLSQEELAKKANLSRSIIAKIESGEVGSVSLNTLSKIGNVFGVEVRFVSKGN